MKKSSFFLIFFAFFIIFGVAINILNSSLITYYYSDHIFMEILHNISSGKKISEILINKYNIFGIPFIPINPNLNLLSDLNYNLNSQYGYVLYLTIFRIIEFITYYLMVNYFLAKKSNLLIPSIIFLIFVYHFNVFDHQSYVNFPIIIFNLTIIVSLYIKQNLKLFSIVFLLGNFWSYLINPTYFFIVVFGPFLFFLIFLILNREYKKTLLSILINIPFALHYIGLTSGTARFALSKLITNETDLYYNFSVYNSKLFIIFLLLILFLYFLNYKKKNLIVPNEFKSISIILIIFLVIGALIKLEILFQNFPHPSYVDYSLQYIYLSLVAVALIQLSKNFKVKILFYIFFFSLIIFKFYSVHKNIVNYDYLVENNSFYENTNLVQRYFWQKNKEFKFKNDAKKKSVLIDIPNDNSDFVKYIFQNKVNDKDTYNSRIFYNNLLEHSLTWNEFAKNEMFIDEGHSLLLNINTFLALNPNKLRKSKNTIGSSSNINNLNNFFGFELILSDRELNLKKISSYDYSDFKLFMYEYPKRQSYTIDQIKFKGSYKDDLKYFNEVIFTENKEKNKFLNITEFCQINNQFNFENQIIYKIYSNKEKCLAIFPIPFSHTDNFYKNNKKIETFKLQHYFHAAILNKNDLIKVKKKNLYYFPYYSFLDYIKFGIGQNEHN